MREEDKCKYCHNPRMIKKGEDYNDPKVIENAPRLKCIHCVDSEEK